MNHVKFCLMLIVIFSININGHSQSNSDQPLINLKSTTEKVYLHTDKDVYQLGDTLWFKAYFTKFNHVRSLSSNVLSLALYNDKNEMIIKEHFKVLDACSEGDFVIPDYVDDGDYKLVAYSDYMQNTDSTNLFSKTIRIYENRPAFQIVIKEQLEYHNLGDSVDIKLLVLTKDNQAIEKVPVKVALVKGKRTYDKLELESDKDGKINLKLKIPEKDLKDQLYIEATSNYLRYNVRSTRKLAIKGENYQFRFFPEGGELVRDVTNRIAFEVYDDYNNLVNIKGLLKDSIGTIIDSIHTPYAGIGSFSYKPQIGSKYFIEILEPYKSEELIELPEAKLTGISLRINHQKERKISITLNASEDLKSEEVNVVFSSGDEVYWNSMINLRTVNKIIIPIDELDEGLSQITVFTVNNKPIAERLIFIPSERKLKIKVKTSKKTYKPKEKVDLNIEVTDMNGNPVSSNLSISVVDETSILPNNHNHIVTYNLFDGELSENLNDQLLLDNHFINQDYADLILMTKGWRRFKWEETQESETDESNNINKKFISGRVENYKGKPVKKANVQLFNPYQFQIVNTSTDENGEFSFNAKEYISVADTGLLVIAASRRNGETNIDVVLDSTYTPVIGKYIEIIETSEDLMSSNSYEAILNGTENQDYYKDFDAQTTLIEEVSVKGRRKVKIDEAAYRKRFHAIIAEADDVSPGYITDDTWIGILFKMTLDITITREYQVLFRGHNSLQLNKQSGALIVVDGMAMGEDIRVLNNLNKHDIKSIKIVKNPTAALKYGAGTLGGLIEITTKSSKDFKGGEYHRVYNNKIDYNGYKLAREFYSPIYKTDKEKLNTYDIRNTLYWNQNLNIDQTGTKKISFYNSDQKMKVRVIVEGMNFDRMAGHGEAEFVVY